MYFDHEKLHVYQASLKFVAFASELVHDLKGLPAWTRDQLLRSSGSITLNIAEGNGKRSPADKRRFFEIARGSATESAATLDVIVAMHVCSTQQIEPGKELLLPVVKMLSKMTENYGTEAREDSPEYNANLEKDGNEQRRTDSRQHEQDLEQGSD